jgi:hypothetical protein
MLNRYLHRIYDNAPHFPNIITYPHHKRIGSTVDLLKFLISAKFSMKLNS